MTLLQAIIAYAVCWWLIFFMALPFGIRRQENAVAGADAGAPEKTHLGVKIAAVTLLAALATLGIDLFLRSGIVTLR